MELTEEGISLAELALETGDLWDENDPWARYLLVTITFILYVPNGDVRLRWLAVSSKTLNVEFLDLVVMVTKFRIMAYVWQLLEI